MSLLYMLGFLVASVSYAIYHKYTNVYTSIVHKPMKRYDYIVGAGTAGCVLAARLSENPEIKVLLVEAGDHMSYFTKIPLTPTAAQQGPYDWSVKSISQKYSSFGLWRQTQFIPRGKGLGGSGQINFLQHGFGMATDYDKWSDLDFKGWTADDLRPYFIKAFGTAMSEFDSTHCSVDGYCPGNKVPMKLKLLDEQNELMSTFKQASSAYRYKDIIFRRATATVHGGKRHSTFDAYLKPAMKRNNLHVLLNTQAVSIRFENNTASSLYILQNHRQLDNIFANKEIILSAGVINTPQILILSGIGPRQILQRLKIHTIVENEHVGHNLHDHMNMPVYVSIEKPFSITLSKVFTLGTVWDYFWNNEGLLSFPPVAGVEYRNSSALILFSMGTANERLLRDLSNYKPQVFRDTFPFHNNTRKEGFVFLATCTQPESRGTVTLSSSSISVQPVVDPNYLEQYSDVRCMIKAIRRAEQLVATKPFRDIGAKIHWPRLERCLSFWNYPTFQQIVHNTKQKKARHVVIQSTPAGKSMRLVATGIVKTTGSKETKSKGTKVLRMKTQNPPDAYLECIIREVAVTGHHVGGTCSGGKVVDQELRVKSISGLRIMDSSTIPAPISLYPNSVIIAMAEKAAELIIHEN